MVTEGYEQYINFGKNFTNPWNNMGKTALDIYRRVGQEALEITEENLIRTADQLKRCGSAKRPDEWFNLQKEFLNENLNAWLSNCQRCLNFGLGNVEEFNKAMNSNIKDQQGSSSGTSSSRGTTERTK